MFHLASYSLQDDLACGAEILDATSLEKPSLINFLCVGAKRVGADMLDDYEECLTLVDLEDLLVVVEEEDLLLPVAGGSDTTVVLAIWER